MKYRIWCEVWGGVTGARQSWMKDTDGGIQEYDNKEDAEKVVGNLNRSRGRNSTTSFRYTVKEM